MSSSKIRDRSQLQEKRAAKDIGGRMVAGSGAAKFSGGGDVRKQGEFRIECKYTEKSYYSLRHADLKKIQLQALKGGMETPIMQVEFITPPTLMVAITSAVPGMDGDAVDWRATTKKQIKLDRDELIRELLGSRKLRLLFSRDLYIVTAWHFFLSTVEEQEEDQC